MNSNLLFAKSKCVLALVVISIGTGLAEETNKLPVKHLELII